MANTIVSDICVDELFNWLSDEGNKALVERSSRVLSTFHHYGDLDPVTKMPTKLSHEASKAINELRSILSVYQLVNQHIELLENN